MKRHFIPVLALLCIATVACGPDSPTEPRFTPEPPASSVPAYKLAYTASQPPSLVVIESGGATRTVLTDAGTPKQPAWSPTGKRLAFTTSGSSETLLVWDSDTNVLSQVASFVPTMSCSIRFGCTVNEPLFSLAWSPDGSRLAFLLRGVLRIASFEGSATQSVSSPTVVATPNFIRWSFDGASLLFAHDDSLLSIPVAGAPAFSTVARGFESGAYIAGFELSPDGKKIAIGTAAKLHIWDVASRTSITVDAPSYFPPAWSPDGTRLAVSSGAISVVNRDGRSLRRISSESMFSRVAWLPDGMNVVYVLGGLAIANVVGGAAQIVVAGSREFAVAPK